MVVLSTMAALIRNKKARFDYEFKDTFEAGLELLGTEVKSVRGGQGALDGGQAIIRGGEAYLVGVYIPPYQPNNTPKGYDPYRTRRMLMKKSEILALAVTTQSQPLTIIPISLYNKGGKIKVEVALCKKKSKHDRRQTLRRKDDEKRIREAF